MMDDSDLDRRLRGRTFVCGVGVQKAGTTWLHDYLAGRPEILMSGRKELHYFDRLFAGQSNTQIESSILRSLRRQIDGLSDSGPITYSERLIELVDMLRMQYDPEGYAAYFAARVGERPLFGEITPAYCLIGTEGFRYMRGLFPRVRIIYLMRDPVERHHSLMRMKEEARGEPGFAARNFLLTLDSRFSHGMADYRSHLEALQAVFTPEELFVGFYETLFSDAEIERLCAFLGIDFMPAAYGTRLNTSSAARSLDPELVRTAVKRLKPTYDYCRQVFGELPAAWQG